MFDMNELDALEEAHKQQKELDALEEALKQQKEAALRLEEISAIGGLPLGAPRVYAFSDLHTDHKANLELLRGLPARPRDVLIVAGDISHQIPILRETLTVLKGKFLEVFFCPGNHDLWLDKNDGCTDSVQKIQLVESICAELGVRTKPAEVGGILIMPIYSWYEPAFDDEPDVSGVDADNFAPVEKALGDFMKCKWPIGLSGSDATLSEYFDAMNEEKLCPTAVNRPVITFSHFLPRLELLPEKRTLFYPPLARVVGSRALRTRVERLVGEASQHKCHIFGHTHYGWSQTLDGVKYLQAAIASPGEWSTRGFALDIKKVRQVENSRGADEKLLQVSSLQSNSSISTMASLSGEEESQEQGPEHGEPALVYDPALTSGPDAGVPQYAALWSEHYVKYPRTMRQPQGNAWLYRDPRPRESVGKVVKTLLLAGRQVTDSAVQAELAKLRALETGTKGTAVAPRPRRHVAPAGTYNTARAA